VIDYSLVVGIQSVSVDLTHSLVQEVIVRMILKEEEEGVVQVLLCHHLMQLSVVHLEYLC
jgi:hypothetical protein